MGNTFTTSAATGSSSVYAPRTVADYLASMKHAIGNADPATGVTLLTLLNDTLRELFSYADWAWRERPPALLDLVSGQSYVTLPSDFGEIVSVHSTSNPTTFVTITSESEIAALRGALIANTLSFYVAISNPTQDSPDTRPLPPRLEVWPTPSVDKTGAISLVYKASAIDLVNTTDVPNIPAKYEAALDLMARGKARIMECDGDASLYAMGNAMLEKLREDDGMQQGDFGQPVGGAVEMRRHGCVPWRPFTSIPLHS